MTTSRLPALCLGLLAVVAAAAAADKLEHYDFRWKSDSGRDLATTFQEVRRTDKTSTVKVDSNQAALESSVGSSMSIMHGFYRLARKRGATYFIKLKEWTEPNDKAPYYLVGFARDPHVDPRKYFGIESGEQKFISVASLDPVFKDKP